jgi:DNA-binding transcriptional LysR family regulator
VRVDLLSVGADLAIRIGPLIDSSLLSRKLAPHRRIVCASPAYLGRTPPISEPLDLLLHNCLVYTLQPTDRWFFRHQDETGEAFEQVPVTGSLRADDSEPLRDAAVAGIWGRAPPDMAGRRGYQGGSPAARASRVVLYDRDEAEWHLRGLSSASHGATEGAGLSGFCPETVWQATLLGS